MLQDMFGTWTAMPDRDKDRLYLVLAHRSMKRPGFHWALMVVPKKGSKNGNMQGAHVFHAVNTYTSANVPLDHNNNPLWRYENNAVDTMLHARLVARFLVAKLVAGRSTDETITHVDSILKQVPLVQGDPRWTCISWLIDALATLRDKGGDFDTIPVLSRGATLEKEIIAFGELGSKTRFSDIKKAPLTEIPIPEKDIRLGRSTK